MKAIEHITSACRFCERSCDHIEFLQFAALTRVGSDSKPQPAGGRLMMCSGCGAVSKPVDPVWQAECKNIYESYEIYQQGDGAEARVFQENGGASRTRSVRLCEMLERQLALPQNGTLLDIGCGGGPFLKAFGTVRPRWRMAGMEINANYTAAVEAIPNVSKMYTCPLKQIPGSYDVVSLVHVFEHVIELGSLLMEIRGLLAPQGILLIEVPDHCVNPFDLLIADHCNHFTMNTMRSVLELNGFEIVSLTNELIPKEISLLARFTGVRKIPGDSEFLPGNPEVISRIQSHLSWIESVSKKSQACRSDSKSYGIFGSSNAAGWLLGASSGKPDFLVDEDPARNGGKHLGVPISSPDGVQSDSTVFIPLAPIQAGAIQRRLEAQRPDVHWVTLHE